MRPKSAIVIGGGIAGCSTAYALAQRGIQVSLLEQHAEIASEGSGNPVAMLYPRLSGDDASSELALAGYLYSLQLFKNLDLTPEDFKHCGLLQLGFNARELARIKKVAAKNYPANILRYVTGLEAAKLANIPLVDDALYFPNGTWVKPQALCLRLTQHKNISLKTLTNVNHILKNNTIYEAYSDGLLTAKADVVIIATANHTQIFNQTAHLKTQAVRGQISLLAATEMSQKLQMIVCSDGYISPAVNHQHCLGATFSTAESQTDFFNLIPTQTDHLSNLTTLRMISAPLYESLYRNVTGGRVAFRCSSSDYFPLVGELLDVAALTSTPPRPTALPATLPWLQGLYINIAHGSKGFTSAPLCAELLACLICNEPLPISVALASLLNPNRFVLRGMGLKHLSKTLAISKS